MSSVESLSSGPVASIGKYPHLANGFRFRNFATAGSLQVSGRANQTIRPASWIDMKIPLRPPAKSYQTSGRSWMIHSSLKVQAYWCQGNFEELLPPYPIVATSNTSPMCSCRRLAISRVMRASPVGAETASEKSRMGIFSLI